MTVKKIPAGFPQSTSRYSAGCTASDPWRREAPSAIEAVNGLVNRPELNPDEEDYLDVLGLLIADYEDSIDEHPDFTSWRQ